MEAKIIIIALVAVSLVTFIVAYKLLTTSVPTTDTACNIDSDCVPAQCCHPTSCVNIKYKPDCTGVVCTQICQGPIDCGAGSCKCVSNKCAVVPAR